MPARWFLCVCLLKTISYQFSLWFPLKPHPNIGVRFLFSDTPIKTSVPYFETRLKKEATDQAQKVFGTEKSIQASLFLFFAHGPVSPLTEATGFPSNRLLCL